MASTTPNTSILIPRAAQQGILEFSKQCSAQTFTNNNMRENMRAIDLAYIRETDQTTEHQRAKAANSYGDTTRYQNITVPVVMPQVESAVTYQSAVFLQGNPLFGVVASPEFEDQAIQMEAIIADQAMRGGWVRQFMLALKDGFKYNRFAVEIDWARQVTPAFETDLSFSATEAKPKETIWQGNTIKRLDLYNTICDTRVPATESHSKGEFAGYTELMSRVQLKELINRLPEKMVDNLKSAFESGSSSLLYGTNSGGAEGFYVPYINPSAFLDNSGIRSTDWQAWMAAAKTESGIKIQYKNTYEVTTLYGRIIPSDFGIRVPSPNTPQVWKFIIVNHQVIIYAERQTNAHGWLPIIFGQPLEDGMSNQTKSLAQNVLPIQELSSALMAASVSARRRAISDRGLYDPSRVSEANINSDNPSAKIPVRPAAYGKPLSEAYYSIPFQDNQSPTIMQEMQQLQAFGNIISGRNQAQQGQFVKGNKTLHEYESVMSHANGRDQNISLMLEAQFFSPLKEIIKLNILQYQGGTTLFNPTKNSAIKIDPVALRNAVLNFKVSDGLTPSDKLIGAEAFATALQTIGSSPQIGVAYNIGPMFSYLMKTQGAHITEFEKSNQQQAYEQAVTQWQQVIMQLAKQNPDITPDKFPPQPVPQTFGYIPGAPASQQGQPAAAAPVTSAAQGGA